jgi:putative flippase GtrA
VEILFWDAIRSQISTTAIIILVSYLSQKHFTFKVEKKDQDFPF